jgi:hypothetical protein
MRTTLLLLLVIAAAPLSCSTNRTPVADATPTFRAARISHDFNLDGDLSKSIWRKARPVTMERESKTTKLRPELATSVRALWTDQFLYLAYDCPYTKLTFYEPVQEKERFGLWERDVVEAFIGSDTNNIRRYTEYEVSPNNERLDVRIALPNYDFEWSSHFESATHSNEKNQRWTAELRIPMSALSDAHPVPGAKWRINLYRCDYANKGMLAFSPTLVGSFHTPEKFGVLKFER